MDDFDCVIPDTFLFGTLRIQVRCRHTGKPLEGVPVSVADSMEEVLGLCCGAEICVTDRSGWAEIEMPMGQVMVAVGRNQIQETWVALDEVVELEFLADSFDLD